MTKLPLGKIPMDVLSRTVLSKTGAASDRIVTPPKAGLDFAAIELDDGFLIVSADPITGVSDLIGSYAVDVSANDVATSGNRPQFIESVVLLPERSGTAELVGIADQMHRRAKALGIAIVGGHTEVTPGLKRSIVAVTAFSFVKDYVSSEDAMPGDSLMMTKTAGIEGTAAIARERRISGGVVPQVLARKAGSFVSRLSIVDEAERAYATGFVRAMHDCTEGGVLGASYEMSLASGAGFVLRGAAVPVAPETRKICSLFALDPLKLIGSGSVLMAVQRGKERRVKEALEGICGVAVVGEFTKSKRLLVRDDGTEVAVESGPEDELWRVLGKSGWARQGLRL
jgi:hydrogenase expression/formation protein HypE